METTANGFFVSAWLSVDWTLELPEVTCEIPVIGRSSVDLEGLEKRRVRRDLSFITEKFLS